MSIKTLLILAFFSISHSVFAKEWLCVSDQRYYVTFRESFAWQGLKVETKDHYSIRPATKEDDRHFDPDLSAFVERYVVDGKVPKVAFAYCQGFEDVISCKGTDGVQFIFDVVGLKFQAYMGFDRNVRGEREISFDAVLDVGRCNKL